MATQQSTFKTRDRWDRARFHDEERKAREYRGTDYYEEDEEEYYRASRRDRSAEDLYQPDLGNDNLRERFVFRDRGRGPPPGRLPDYYYEAQDVYEIDVPQRPRIRRRQSSLDTYDRQPYITLERRHLSPDLVTVTRDREKPRLRRLHSPESQADFYNARLERNPDSTMQRRFDVDQDSRPYPRSGKTKIPLRMVREEAVSDLGYPFHVEDQMIIVHRALSRQQIDEIVHYKQDTFSVKSERESEETLSEKRGDRTTNIEIEVGQNDPISAATIGVAALLPENNARAPRSRIDITDQVQALRLEARGVKAERITSSDLGGQRIDIAERGTRTRRERRGKIAHFFGKGIGIAAARMFQHDGRETHQISRKLRRLLTF